MNGSPPFSCESFVVACKESGWFPVGIPTELVRIVADYFCPRLYSWDSALRDRHGLGEPGVTLYRPSEAGPSADTESPPFLVLESILAPATPHISWRRGWGLQAIGSAPVLPHFAIRLSSRNRTEEVDGLVVGVTCVKSIDSDLTNNGVDTNTYGLLSTPRELWSFSADTDTSFPARGIMAMHECQ